MCYFNGIQVSKGNIISLKGLEANFTEDRVLVQGFDYTDYPIVRSDGPGIKVDDVHWEFIPFWIKDFESLKSSRFKYDTLNAKGETLLSSKMFREAALKRRCLVLSSGFFEWRHIFPLNKKTGQPLKTAIKYPHYISMKGKSYFFMAGIWQSWTDKATGETADTFAICTTEANELMAQVHNNKKRMPTILPEQQAFDWLFKDLTEDEITMLATNKIPAIELTAYPIHKDFRTNADPTEPAEYPELPALIIL